MVKILIGAAAIAGAVAVVAIPSAASAQSTWNLSIGNGYPGYYQSYDPYGGNYDQSYSYSRDSRTDWNERQRYEQQRRWEARRRLEQRRYYEQQRRRQQERRGREDREDDDD